MVYLIFVSTSLQLNLEISFPLHILKTLFDLNFKNLRGMEVKYRCYYLEKKQSDIDKHNNSSNPDIFSARNSSETSLSNYNNSHRA